MMIRRALSELWLVGATQSFDISPFFLVMRLARDTPDDFFPLLFLFEHAEFVCVLHKLGHDGCKMGWAFGKVWGCRKVGRVTTYWEGDYGFTMRDDLE